tara:strand:+ start:1315 stop:1959 length:645 start_codon:yes stop_codon:yes gene_type:complete
MLYDNIKKEIGKRLGDPFLDKYRALVGNVFVESLGNMLKEDDYGINEIESVDSETVTNPLLTKKIYSYSQVGLNNTKKFQLESDVFIVQDVLFGDDYSNISPESDFVPTLKEISKDTQRRMAIEDALKPSGYEIFYIINNYSITFYSSAEIPNGNINIDMYYFKAPSNDEWSTLNDGSDGLNLETSVGLSPQLIQRAINRSVMQLSGEAQGEKE